MLSPDLTLGCDEVICINEGCILLGTAFTPTPDVYNWLASPNGGLPANTNQNSIAINPESTGTFTYQYWISANGCESDTASLTVEVVDRPDVNNDFFETNYQLPIENFTVTDNDVITPQLTDGDIQVIALPMDGTLQMNEDGEFTYIPNDGFIGVDFFLYQICYNCEESQCDTGRVELRVYFEGDCEVPNIITSNGDGINDELVINCLETGDFPDSEITVYNNWGDKVFNASPYQNDWDGTLSGKKGKPLPDGTYYFIFKESKNAKAQKGYVMIFR
jgi:gliding motility-associated-like protein